MQLSEIYSLSVVFMLGLALLLNIIVMLGFSMMTIKFRNQAKISNGITNALYMASFSLFVERIWSIWVSGANLYYAIIVLDQAADIEPNIHRLLWLSARVISLVLVLICGYALMERLKYANE